MAKIKMSGIGVVDIRGKLNGSVFSKNRGGAYVRTKVSPSNPQSTFQMSVRGIFAAISSAWSALTEAQRLSWNGFVASYGRTDVFGDIRNPSGKNLFQRLNQNLVLTGQPQISTCVAPSEVPFLGLTSVDGDVSGSTLSFSYSGDVNGNRILVFATPAMSQGTKFVKNQLRVITSSIGGDGLTEDVYAEYVAKFGIPTAGANIVFGCKVINANGQASPLETVKAVIIA